jgi:hypothetical protein
MAGDELKPFGYCGQHAVPSSSDLAGWKAADKSLSDRIREQLRRTPTLLSARAVKRYFGKDDLEYFVSQHAEQGVAEAYTAWAVLGYRPTFKSKTQAEKMLEKGLPEAEAILLRARLEAHPSLYRVAGHDAKAGTVTLEDVLLGGAVTVNDRLMSQNIEDGFFLVVRVFPAGSYYFLDLAGPPLGPGMGAEVLDCLHRWGVEFTREGLRRDDYVFGWLWHSIDRRRRDQRPPRLLNMDGDDLLWHTASFAVADERQVRQILSQREDIEYDKENEEYVWYTEKGRGAKMMAGPVTLGRIELVGDELVLTVNSANRFAAGRKWLEKIPGVVFQGVRTRQWNEPEADRPMDERIAKPQPVEMTPELTAAVQQMINRQYMTWLDTRLPVLAGKSPRQACRTAAGRQQVAMLIRTIPDPMGRAPVQVPRQAMLRALGLGGETSAASDPSPPGPELPPPAKSLPVQGTVGRNAPCPCGSGRKYKKCCGKG